MDIRIKVIGKKVLAIAIPKEVKAGVLILPDEKKTEQIVQVVSVGDDMPVQNGDKIICKSHWMHKITHNDQELFLIPLEDIIGIVQ